MTEFKVGDTVGWGNVSEARGIVTEVISGKSVTVRWDDLSIDEGYSQRIADRHLYRIEEENNPIEPNHYQRNGVNFIEFIEHMSGNRFNAMKYIYRAGDKNPETLLEDLKKGQWSLNREIERLERG